MDNHELHSLVQACKENLEDEVHRGILADWLEEAGDPRAEVVRNGPSKTLRRFTLIDVGTVGDIIAPTVCDHDCIETPRIPIQLLRVSLVRRNLGTSIWYDYIEWYDPLNEKTWHRCAFNLDNSYLWEAMSAGTFCSNGFGIRVDKRQNNEGSEVDYQILFSLSRSNSSTRSSQLIEAHGTIGTEVPAVNTWLDKLFPLST